MDKETPPRFSEVIGALVASVAYARSVADVEALRIAYRYQQNELLKGLPVPRLRFKQVSISLPVILSDVIPGTPAEANVPSAIAEKARKAFQEGLTDARERLEVLEKMENVSPDEKEKIKFYRELFNCVEQLGTEKLDDSTFKIDEILVQAIKKALQELASVEGGIPPSDAAIKDAVGNAVIKIFSLLLDEASFRYLQEIKGQSFDGERARKSREEINNHPFVQRVIQDIRQAAKGVAILKPTVPPDFYVSVNTDNIKSIGGGPDAVTRLGMVLREEGLEWLTEVTHEGIQTTRLLPE